MRPGFLSRASLRASLRRSWLLIPLAVVIAAGLLAPGRASAHGGPLDEYGGHFDESTGLYHYHKPARDMAARKREWLTWSKLPVSGEIQGTVSSVEDSDSFWLYVPYRPAYQELVQSVLPANRDDRQQLVRIRLSYVSPRETGARDARFAEWFTAKVAYELRQKLDGRPVRVAFQLAGGNPGWLRGMVFVGSENVNLWMVLNGWSYYVVADGDTRYDAPFRKAEDTARQEKAGIWEHIR